MAGRRESPGWAGPAGIGLACALLAVGCALLAAYGPAHHQFATVRWPEAEATAAPGADGLFYSPLLLANHSAQWLDLTLPCTVPGRPSRPVLVFATARSDEVWRLRVVHDGTSLSLTTGKVPMTSVPWPAGASTCRAGLRFDGDQWVLSRDDQVLAEGAVFPPAIGGFFTELDPSRVPLAVELQTQDYSSTPSMRQWALHLLTALFGAGALFAIARSTRRVALPAPLRPRGPRPKGHPIDALVGAAILVWWAAGPGYYDDGWLMATVFARRSTGASSNYYDSYAASLPLGFLHHIVLLPFAYAKAPFLYWRIAPLLACLGVWVLLRIACNRLLGDQPPLVGLAALAASHLVFCYSWLMTLRPEPDVALLSGICLIGCIGYRDSRSRRALTAAVLAAAVATTLHPSGMLAAAPFVTIVPTFARDLRDGAVRALELVAIGALGAATGVAMLFADTDLELWRRSRAAFIGDGFHNAGWRQEPDRYHDLLNNGTMVALASVLFPALAIVLWLSRRRRTAGPIDVAGLSLIVAALMLCFTPSKWLYHFGSGAVIASTALAVEIVALRADDRRTRVVGAGALLAAGVITARALRGFRDPQYFLGVFPPDVRWLGKTLPWVAAAALALIVPSLRGGRERRAQARTAAVQWGLVAAIGSIVVLMFATRAVAPFFDSPYWSVANRGIDGIRNGGCQFNALTDVADVSRRQVLSPATITSAIAGTPVIPAGVGDASTEHLPTELASVTVHSTRADGARQGTLTTAWYTVPALGSDSELVVAVRGITNHFGNRFDVEWGRRQSGGAVTLQRHTLQLDRDARGVGAWELDPWRKVRLSRAAAPPVGADLVRFVLVDGSDDPDAFIAVTAPLVAPHLRLSELVADRTVLVSPGLMPLATCLRLPRVDHGVAEMPDVSIGFVYRRAPFDDSSLGGPKSPWYTYREGYAMTNVWAWLNDRDAAPVSVLLPASTIGRLVPAAVTFAHT